MFESSNFQFSSKSACASACDDLFTGMDDTLDAKAPQPRCPSSFISKIIAGSLLQLLQWASTTMLSPFLNANPSSNSTLLNVSIAPLHFWHSTDSICFFTSIASSSSVSSLIPSCLHTSTNLSILLLCNKLLIYNLFLVSSALFYGGYLVLRVNFIIIYLVLKPE